MANNKVQLANGTVLIDLTADTVDAAHLAEGYTAHDASGAAITGTMSGGGGLDDADALLRVVAPKNSVVTISSGGSSKTSNGFISDTRGTTADYYFPLKQVEYGTWTISASRDGETATGTVTVNSSGEHTTSVWYHVPILEYQEVEYLLTSGTQYIMLASDIFSSGYVAKIKYKTTTFATQNPVLNFGTTNNAAREGNIGTSASGYSAWFNHADQTLIAKSDDGIVTAQVINDRTSITVDLETDDNTGTYTWRVTPNFTGGTMICRNGRTTYQYGKYYVYYYELMNGNTPVRQMYPCYRLSDNVAGMYDKVSGTFFTNAGNGSFAVGSDV